MTSQYGHTQVVNVGNNVPVRLREPVKLAIKAASTANISDLTAASSTVDGVTCVDGDVVLLKDQSTASQNGLYAFSGISGGAGVLTRVGPLAEGWECFPGTAFYVESGTVNGKVTFELVTTGTITLGSTSLSFKAVSQPIASTQAQINVPISGGILAAGTPMAAFADNASSNPGITLADSKAYAIRWNNAASQTAVWFGVALPQDLDDAADIVLHFLASKSGATLADATTITVTAFFQTVGALHDADADCGGATGAVTGDAAAKTVSELTRAIAAADVPAAPCFLSFSIKPTNGTLATDDFLVEAIWIEYTRKPLNS